MKKILKVIGIILGVIVVVIAGYYTKAYLSVENRRHTHYKVTPQSLSIKTDSAQLALGGRLVKAKGCTECHGVDLGGKVFIDDPALGHIIAANLTNGKGGLSDYTKTDWIRALKHGV